MSNIEDIIDFSCSTFFIASLARKHLLKIWIVHR